MVSVLEYLASLLSQSHLEQGYDLQHHEGTVMMKKYVTACLTAAAVLAAPVAVSGTLTAGAIAQEAPAPAPAADQKPDVLGRPTVSEQQVSDEEGYFDSAHGEASRFTTASRR